MTLGRRVAPAAVIAGLAVLGTPAAASQAPAGQRHPSARELWRSYPLGGQKGRSGPAPTPAGTVVAGGATNAPRHAGPARTAGTGGATNVRRHAGGGSAESWLVPLLIVAAVALAAGVVVRERRRSAEREPPDEPAAGPVPPAPEKAWTAEIDWSHGSGGSTFAVIATAADGGATERLAESSRLEWPPSGPAAVQAMTDAAQALEISLLAAGWRPLPPGTGWYAKRFAWRPPGARRRTSRRFLRSAGWPDGAEQLWRCEIRRHAGPMSAGFRAVAYPPGGEGGRVVADSGPFRRLRPGEPAAPMAEQRSAVEALAAALEAAGWERVASGQRWYAERFVWRHAGAPPESVVQAPAERSP